MRNIKINDHITLATRKNTKFLQAVIKDPTGEWRRISTKTSDVEKATEFAFKKLGEWQVLKDHGVELKKDIGRTFEKVATKFIDITKQKFEEGQVSLSVSTYRYPLGKYLIPFFGEMNITKINEDSIDDYCEWLQKQFSKVVPKSTLNKHVIAFKAVMKFAAREGWINKSEIPEFSTKGRGRKSNRRGHFEPDEFNKILEFLRNWHNSSDQYITQYKRKVLYKYFYFLGVSGIRPGTEALGICWSDLEFVPLQCPEELLVDDFDENDNPIKRSPIFFDRDFNEYPYGRYRVYKRKGKKRALDQEGEVRPHYSVITQDTFFQLDELKDLRANKIEDDDLVFCMPDGSPIKDFTEMFRNALETLDMRYGADGRVRTLYSLRHSYATWKLRNGDMGYEKLKRQMDTSIAMLEAHYDHVEADDFADELMV